MFRLFLNAVEIALSEDFRDGTRALIDLVRQSHNLEDDQSFEIEVRIASFSQEKAELLCVLAMQKMNIGDANKFKVVYDELVKNAFEHNCKNDKDIVNIKVSVTLAYISLIIKHPREIDFNLEQQLSFQKRLLRENPHSKRGRGLITADTLSDDLKLRNKEIKSIIYISRRPYSGSAGNTVVFPNEMINIYQPDFAIFDGTVAKFFRSEYEGMPVNTIILSLKRCGFIDSSGMGALVSMFRKTILCKSDFLIVDPSEQQKMLFELTSMNKVFKVLNSLEEALRYLSKDNLLVEIQSKYSYLLWNSIKS